MPITFECTCGKMFQVADHFAGKRTKCTACASPLTVPQPQPISEPEDEGYEVVDERSYAIAEPARPEPARPLPVAKAAAKSPPVQPSPLGASRWAEKPVAKPSIEEEDDEDDRPSRPRRKKRRRPRPDSSSGGGVNGGAVGAGLFIMFIAVVWFVVGLYAGWIFFYPPILFVIGIISLVKGLMGIEDE